MQRCAFTPYEGKKPYIFVSYAHKDSDRVFPILEELDRRGYRVWYDDGIAPGSEWPENIAQHLDGCSLTLAFISPASIASPNCRREVTFALSRRKPFLGILLEPTEMSLGMEMQLSAQQCIMKYTYQSEPAFFAKVCSCPDLQPCLGQPKVVSAPENAPTPEVQVSAPVAPIPAPVIKPPREKKPLDKKRIGILSGAAAAVVVAVIVLIIALSGGTEQPDNGLDHGNNPQTSGTGSHIPSDSTTQSTAPDDSTQETYLCYEDQVITAQDIAYISRQTKLDKLEMYGCQIQTGALDALTLANTVTELVMVDCQGVTNLKCLASLENLVSLHLEGCDITDDALEPMKAAGLRYVNISRNTQFSDLSVFAACIQINDIAFERTSVASVACLRGMADLRTVNGSFTLVKDITPLAELTELLELRFAGCGIEAIDATFDSLYLQTLDLSSNLLTNLNAFENCTVLEFVNLSFNQLESTYPLAKSAAALQILYLSGNEQLNSNNVSFLKNSVNAKELYLDGVSLFDLDMLENMQQLQRLSAVGCLISDLDGLKNTVGELLYLNLAENGIRDIHVLSGLKNEGLKLDLGFNTALRDVSALPADLCYEVLNLTLEYLDLSTVPNVTGTYLLLPFQYGMEENAWLKTDPFANYIIVGCPTDQIVTMETLLGRNEVMVVMEMADYLAVLCDIIPEARVYAYILENMES